MDRDLEQTLALAVGLALFLVAVHFLAADGSATSPSSPALTAYVPQAVY